MKHSTKALVISALISIVLLGVGVAAFAQPAPTEHEYTVKTEQVETDAGYSDEAIPVESLTTDEQEALQRAFKQSDTFLDGVSVRIETDERLDLDRTTEWLVVEVQGVHLLAVIQYEGAREEPTIAGITGLLFITFAIIHAVLSTIPRGIEQIG